MQVAKMFLHGAFLSLLTIAIIADVYADDESTTVGVDSGKHRSTPEAAALFESLVQSIPAGKGPLPFTDMSAKVNTPRR